MKTVKKKSRFQTHLRSLQGTEEFLSDLTCHTNQHTQKEENKKGKKKRKRNGYYHYRTFKKQRIYTYSKLLLFYDVMNRS